LLNRRENEYYRIRKKYNYTFDPFFKKLWNAGLLDWFKGWKNTYQRKLG